MGEERRKGGEEVTNERRWGGKRHWVLVLSTNGGFRSAAWFSECIAWLSGCDSFDLSRKESKRERERERERGGESIGFLLVTKVVGSSKARAFDVT